MPDTEFNVPAASWRELGDREHFVNLYEDDAALVDSVTNYIGGALAAGSSALLIATASHLRAFEARWSHAGLAVDAVRESGRYIAVDAEDLLAQIFVDGTPDRARFRATVEPLVDRLLSRGARLSIFGELVPILWREQRDDAAIRIQTFWNELAEEYPFALCELQRRAHALDREVEHRQAAEMLVERKAKELADFLDDAPYAMHAVSPDGTIVWANRFELDMLGYSRDEFVGHHVREFYVGAEFPATIVERVMRGETLHEERAQMRCKNGSVREVTVTSNTRREDGFVQTRCFTRDVTEQMRAERALESARDSAQKSDALLAAIVASSDDAIVSKTLEGQVTSWNDGAQRLFGYTRDEMIGSEIMRIVPPELQHEERDILRRLARGERIDHFETQRLRKDGSRVDVSLTISPVRDGDGHIVGASKVARDITERKRVEEQLRVADRRKDEFLAMLGHELRNPLAPIRTVTEVLRRTVGSDSRSLELCAILERQVQQMTRLLDDLLDVTRITRGTIRFQRQRVDVSSVIQRAVEASGPLITRRRQRLRVGVPKTPIWVDGDFARLVQLVTNLLNNAAKYSPVGGRIALRVVRRGDCFDIRVQDNGAGIPPEMLPRVFELFVQSEANGGVQDGLGIGLTLVRVIAEHHDGSVVARSAGAGRGSQFVVTLPVSDADVTAPAAIPADAPAVSGRKRIVIVDDNRDALESLATLLRLSGHEVAVATDGLTGVRIVEETQPDLALLDIGLPGMSGYEIARRLRDGGCMVRLAAITGYGTPEDRERSREAGFDHHFVKPVDLASLDKLLGSAA